MSSFFRCTCPKKQMKQNNKTEQVTMSLPKTYKALRSNPAGEPKLVELPMPKPGKNEVLIKMEYVPVNPSDLMAMGSYFGSFPENLPIGGEGSGTVVALGEDLKVPHNIGDKVHVLAIHPDGTPHFGTYSQYIVVSSETCPKIGKGLSLEEAASHFINPGSVYYMGVLAERGGHKAVIHSAGSSALGKMLIRYLKHKGIKSINIVRRDDYTEELKKEGADYVLNSKDPDFEAKLKEIAEKEKATISFDAIGGSFTGLLIRNQPRGSTCHVYGLLAGEVNIKDVPIMELISGKTVTGLASSPYQNERYRKGELQNFFNEVHSLLPTLFKSHVQKVFKFDELQEAIAFYNKNSSQGKVLLKLN